MKLKGLLTWNEPDLPLRQIRLRQILRKQTIQFRDFHGGYEIFQNLNPNRHHDNKHRRRLQKILHPPHLE